MVSAAPEYASGFHRCVLGLVGTKKAVGMLVAISLPPVSTGQGGSGLCLSLA